MSAAAAARPVAVTLPAALVRLFPGCPRHIELAAGDVAEAFAALDMRWPGLRDRLCDSQPAVRRHINVFVDGERANLTTRLRPGSQLLVMTAISGG